MGCVRTNMAMFELWVQNGRIMIDSEIITKRQIKRLLRLIEKETRCEIMARIGQFHNLGFIDYALKQIEYKDKIREMLFGSSNLVELGQKWKMIK